MARLLRSFFYKLVRDVTFRIVAIIGAALAILLTLIYCLGMKQMFATGAYNLLASISPSQNFGIAIPINLAIFVTLLFTQGIIRNEVIVGNSKLKVYFSLLIGGGVFVLSLVIIYVGICTGLSSIIGGFYDSKYFTETMLPVDVVVKIIIATLVNYLVITTWSVFVATLTRNPGSSIPLVIVPIVLFSVLSMVIVLLSNEKDMIPEGLQIINKYLNPQFLMGKFSGLATLISAGGKNILSDADFYTGLINNGVYIGIFTFLGALAFTKRDLK